MRRRQIGRLGCTAVLLLLISSVAALLPAQGLDSSSFEAIENPTGGTWTAAATIDGNEALIADSVGSLARYDFSTRTLTANGSIPSPVGTQVLEVDAEHGITFDLADGGTLYRRNETSPTFVPVTPPISTFLGGVGLRPGNDPWFVGNVGGLLSFDATTDTFTAYNSSTLSGYNDSLAIDNTYNFVDIGWRPSGDYALVCTAEGRLYKLTPTTLDDRTAQVGTAGYGLRGVTFSADGSKAIVFGWGGLLLWDHATDNGTWLPATEGLDLHYAAATFLGGSSSEALLVANFNNWPWVGRWTSAIGVEALTPPGLSDVTGGFVGLAVDPTGTDGVAVTQSGGMLAFPNRPPTVPSLEAATVDYVSPTSVGLVMPYIVDPDIERYDLYYGTSPGVVPSAATLWATQVQLSLTSYNGNVTHGVYQTSTQANLADSTLYHWLLVAVDSANQTATSAELALGTTDVTNPPVPIPIVSAIGSTSVTLSWSAYVGFAFSNYELFQSTEPAFLPDSGNSIFLTTSIESTTFTDSDLEALTTYYYRLRVTNSYGYSNTTDSVSATTGTPFVTPVTLTVASIGFSSATLNWNSYTGESFHHYEAYLGTQSGFSPGPTTNISSLLSQPDYIYTSTLTLVNLTQGTTYYAIIRVVAIGGFTGDSLEAPFTTYSTTSGTAPTPLVGEVTINSISLAWNPWDGDLAGQEVVDVQYSTTPGFTPGPSTSWGVFNSWTTTATITGLTPATSYSILLRTSFFGQSFIDSPPVSVTTLVKSPPPTLAIVFDDTTGYISWAQPDLADFNRYELHFSATSGFSPDPGGADTLLEAQTFIGTTSFYLNSYLSHFVEGVPYVAVVLLIDNDNLASVSNEVGFKYDPPPAPVYNLHLVVAGETFLTVAWDPYAPPTDFKEFVVQVRTDVTGSRWETKKHLSNSTANQIKIEPLAAGTRFVVRVLVIDAAEQTSELSATSITLETESTDLSQLQEIFGAEELSPLCCGVTLLLLIGTLSGFAQATKRSSFRKTKFMLPIIVIVAIVWVNFLFAFLKFAKIADFGILIPWELFPFVLLLMLIGTVAFAVIWFASRRASKAIKQHRWAKEEAERRQRAFDEGKGQTQQRIGELAAQIDGHRQRAPQPLIAAADFQLGAARQAWAAAATVEQDGQLPAVRAALERTQQCLLDIDAFYVGRDHAGEQLRSLEGRLVTLEAGKAPGAAAARSALDAAMNQLRRAGDLPSIQGVVSQIASLRRLLDEAQSALTSRDDQRRELVDRHTRGTTRLKAFRGENNPDLSLLTEITGELTTVERILVEEGSAPDTAALANGREHMRLAEEALDKVSERSRRREEVSYEVERLRTSIDELGSWTNWDRGALTDLLDEASSRHTDHQLEEAEATLARAWEELATIEREAAPAVEVLGDEEDFKVAKWEDYEVLLKNMGTAAALDVHVHLESPSAQILEKEEGTDSKFTIAPGEEVKVPISIKFDAEGAVPVRVNVTYNDRSGSTHEAHKDVRAKVTTTGSAMRSTSSVEGGGTDDDVTHPIKILARTDLKQGFYVFKVSLRNKGTVVARDVTYRLVVDDKVFRIRRVYPPEYKLRVDSVVYGDIEPGTTRSVEFYLETHMCTETKLQGVLTFKDIDGTIKTYNAEPHKETLVCPIFVDAQSVTPAALKEMAASSDWTSDTKTFAIPAVLPLEQAYEITAEVLQKHNLREVFEDTGEDPYFQQSWFYGQTEATPAGPGIQHIVVARIERTREGASVLQLTGMSPHSRQMFALSARVLFDLEEALREKAQLRQPIQQVFTTAEAAQAFASAQGAAMVQKAAVESTASLEAKRLEEKRLYEQMAHEQDRKDLAAMDLIASGKSDEVYDGGAAAAPTATVDPQKEFSLKTYRSTLVQVYEDGVVDASERNLLRVLRKQLNLTHDEAEALEDEVLRTLRK